MTFNAIFNLSDMSAEDTLFVPAIYDIDTVILDVSDIFSGSQFLFHLIFLDHCNDDGLWQDIMY